MKIVTDMKSETPKIYKHISYLLLHQINISYVNFSAALWLMFPLSSTQKKKKKKSIIISAHNIDWFNVK